MGTCATPPLVLALRICADSAQMCTEENHDDCSLSTLSRARRYRGNRAGASPQAFNRVVSPKRCRPVAREMDSLSWYHHLPASLGSTTRRARGRRHRSVPPFPAQRFRASASTRVLRPAMSDPRNHAGRDRTEALKSASQEVIYLPSYIAAIGCPLDGKDLSPHDAVLLGDIRSDALLNPSQAFRRLREGPA